MARGEGDVREDRGRVLGHDCFGFVPCHPRPAVQTRLEKEDKMSMSKKLAGIVEQAKSYMPDVPETDDLSSSRFIVWWVIAIGCVIVAVAVLWSIFN